MLNFIKTNVLKTTNDLCYLTNNYSNEKSYINNTKLIEIEIQCLMEMFVITFSLNKNNNNICLDDFNVG